MSHSQNVRDGPDKRRTLQTAQTTKKPHISAYSTILSPVMEGKSGKERNRKERGNRRKNRAWIEAKSPDTAEKSGFHIEICPASSCLHNRRAAGFPHLSCSYPWQQKKARLFQRVAPPHSWVQPVACSALLGRVARQRQGTRASGHPSWEVRWGQHTIRTRRWQIWPNSWCHVTVRVWGYKQGRNC